MDEPTWIGLIRDVSHAVRIDGESTVVASLVLDADTGLVRGMSVDRADAGACAQAMRTALTQPAGDLLPSRPIRVLCGVGHREPVTDQLAIVLGDRPLPEVTDVAGAEAEDTAVQRLTVAIAAVLAHDRQPDRSGTTSGTCALAADRQGAYTPHPPHDTAGRR